jgi:hypothetical protein
LFRVLRELDAIAEGKRRVATLGDGRKIEERKARHGKK